MAVLLQHLKLLNQGKFSPPKDYSFSNGTLSPANEKEKVSYDQVIDCSNYLASKGWVDLRCGLGEPGQECHWMILFAGRHAGGQADR
jgi:dihydroorotase